MRIDHIGIIVKDMQRSIDIYMSLGYHMSSGVITDEIQHNNVAVLNSKSAPDVELIEPINEMSSIYNFKEGYHHICYEAEPGEDIIRNFKEMKIGKIFTSPIIAPALNNRKVVFACLQNFYLKPEIIYAILNKSMQFCVKTQ